jgi:ketosteroid isomerase-like protein
MSVDDEILNKVRWLADIEEIKQLKARYAAACDDDYQADALAEMFTEDAIWDGGFMGYAKSKDAIRNFFANASNIVGFAVHGIGNPLIEIDGDHATGRWYLHQPMTMKDSDQCFWFCAQYNDVYQRTPDGWKFEHVLVIPRAFTPYEEGFGKTLMADLPT